MQPGAVEPDAWSGWSASPRNDDVSTNGKDAK
jgi:hypothetical protein